MAASANTTRAIPPARSQPAQQFYLTHCLLVDSVRDVAEFSTRAASTDDRDLLDLVESYPTFDLPVTLWSKDPKPENAVRRLALIRLPDQQQALIHSAYLERDTVGRIGNHFTHVMLGPRFDFLEVVQSWASPNWRVSYPPGEPKVLKRPAAVPLGKALTNSTLSEFLSDAPIAPSDTHLATATVPERLKADGRRRREIMSQFLQAVMILGREGENRRGPLYIHAEPGLLAMLLFGAARLLPRGWTNDLTFSTYENPDTTLRSYNQALVVGTYLDNPKEKLEADYLERYGYGIDTFHPRHYSREFEGTPEEIKALFNLAMNGAWDVIDRLHESWGNARHELKAIDALAKKMLAASRVESHGANGKATVADLRLLLNDEVGRRILERFDDDLWDLIRNACLTDHKLAVEFKHTLLKEPHLGDLRNVAAQSLRKEDLAGWEHTWNLLRSLAGGKENEQLNLLVTEASLGDSTSTAVRILLRREWQRWGKGEALPWRKLQQANDITELDAILADAEIPAAWKANTLCRAVLDDTQFMRARQHLEVNDKSVCQLVIKMGRNEFNKNPMILVRLLGGVNPAHELMNRILETGTKFIDVPTWIQVIKGLDALEAPAWRDYWLMNERLAMLLISLGDVESAREIWQHYLNQINQAFNKDPRQITIIYLLYRALERIERSLVDIRKVLFPPERLEFERRLIVLAIYYPKIPSVDPMLSVMLTPIRLNAACGRTKWDAIEQLRKRFTTPMGSGRGSLADLDPRRPNAALDEFRTSFQRFQGTENWPEVFHAWCKVINTCPKDRQNALQEYYFSVIEKIVTSPRDQLQLIRDLRARVALAPAIADKVEQVEREEQRQLHAAAEEERRVKKEFQAIHEDAVEPEEGGHPVGFMETEAAEPRYADASLDAFDDEKPRRRRRQASGGGGLWVVALVAFLVIGAGAVCYLLFFHDPDKPAVTDVPKAKHSKENEAPKKGTEPAKEDPQHAKDLAKFDSDLEQKSHVPISAKMIEMIGWANTKSKIDTNKLKVIVEMIVKPKPGTDATTIQANLREFFEGNYKSPKEARTALSKFLSINRDAIVLCSTIDKMKSKIDDVVADLNSFK